MSTGAGADESPSAMFDPHPPRLPLVLDFILRFLRRSD